MKKKIKIVISILIGLILLTIVGTWLYIVITWGRGMSGEEHLSKTELKTAKKYSEWLDDVKLWDNKNVELASFNEKDNIIKVKVDVKYSEFEELEDIVDRDNEFIESNPDYFKAGQKRVLYKKRSSEKGYNFILSNTFDFGFDDRECIKNLKLNIPYTKDDLFRITYIPYWKFDKSINKKNTEILLLDIVDLYQYEQKNSSNEIESDKYKKSIQLKINTELIKEYSSLKYVVLLTDDKNDDYDLLKKNIKQACPNITIYVTDRNDTESNE